MTYPAQFGTENKRKLIDNGGFESDEEYQDTSPLVKQTQESQKYTGEEENVDGAIARNNSNEQKINDSHQEEDPFADVGGALGSEESVVVSEVGFRTGGTQHLWQWVHKYAINRKPSYKQMEAPCLRENYRVCRAPGFGFVHRPTSGLPRRLLRRPAATQQTHTNTQNRA